MVLSDEERWAQVTCNACGWKREFSECSFYRPSLKVIYGVGRRGAWTIGDKYVLKEVQTDDPTDPQPRPTVINTELVSKNTTIPVPEIIRTWFDGNRHYTWMTRIPGVNLESVWSTITKEEKQQYAKEVAEYILQLRNLTNPLPQDLEGDTVYDCVFESGRISTRPEEWLKNFNGADAQREKCLQSFPAMGPFTFSHNDLKPANIMIHDGHVSGIIDWDEAGYFPVWWEYIRLRTEFQYLSFGNYVADYLDEISKASYPEVFKFYREFNRLLEKRLTHLEILEEIYGPGKVPPEKLPKLK
ncbi:hypothetical protein MMC17_005321 [Xylographa soralifera]|nr:hypothetical protein [Xylographa soralifera]